MIKINFDSECQSFFYDIRYDDISVCSSLADKIPSYKFSAHKKAFSAYYRIEKKLDSLSIRNLDSVNSLKEIMKAFNTQAAIVEIDGIRCTFNKKELPTKVNELFELINTL